MEKHVLSTLAYENKKEKKGNPPNHDPDKQQYMYVYTGKHTKLILNQLLYVH